MFILVLSLNVILAGFARVSKVSLYLLSVPSLLLCDSRVK